ncbi:hypothetical protein ES707_15170 [subsurface metagenome]
MSFTRIKKANDISTLITVADMGSNRIKNSSGFTLIELVVAIAILGIIVTVIYSSFTSVVALITRSDNTDESFQLARVVFDRIGRDFLCFYRHDSTTVFLHAVDDFTSGYDNDRIDFLTASYIPGPSDPPAGDVIEVGYFLDPDESGILIRRVDITPDKKPEQGGYLIPIADNVAGFDVEYFDGEEWYSEWGEERKKLLPKALRITLSIKEDFMTKRIFTRTISIPLAL